MQTSNMFSRRWRFKNKVHLLGLAAIISLGIAGYAVRAFPHLFSRGHVEYFPTLHSSIFLLISIMILSIHWLNAVQKEVMIYKNYFEDFIPDFSGNLLTTVVLLMALSLGILCYFSSNLCRFSLFLIVYKAIEIWGFSVLKSKLENYNRVVKNRYTPGDGRWQYWEIIAGYYLDQPHISRSLGIIIFAGVSCLVYVLADSFKNDSVKNIFLIASYLIMILNIAVSEFIVFQWRRKRDEALYEYGEYYL